MNRQTFAWGRSKSQLRTKERWTESLYLFGLLAAALIIFTIDLGGLPLQNPEEGIVAQVAKEIARSPDKLENWLFPKLWESDLFSHPPLIQISIALSYCFGGVNEWTTRLPGAILAACSVPLLYKVGRETFVMRTPALYAALMYLTWLPILRQGRLAMLDGPILFFEILTILSVLRSRRDLRWTLGIGLGLSALCLIKGVLGLSIALVAILFLAWDTPRLLVSKHAWRGIGLGLLPAIAWYAVRYWQGQLIFKSTTLLVFFQQSWQHFWQLSTSDLLDSGSYLGEIFLFSWPWLLFALHGIKLAFESRNWSWAKFVLIWGVGYLVAIAPLLVRMPEYILPIYPVLALAGGAKLAQVLNFPSYRPYPRLWSWSLAILAILIAIICLYFSATQTLGLFTVMIFSAIALNLAIVAVLIKRKDRQFISMLFWGMYVSSILFVSSGNWVGQLNQVDSLKPIANTIERFVPQDSVVYTSLTNNRSSVLNFYSDRQVIPCDLNRLKQKWQTSTKPYLLIEPNRVKSLEPQLIDRLNVPSPSIQVLETNENYSQNLVLITKQNYR
ncbi:MAG: ArnT family glycosyltransferase [Xenococcaceae cyanobacterium]